MTSGWWRAKIEVVTFFSFPWDHVSSSIRRPGLRFPLGAVRLAP